MVAVLLAAAGLSLAWMDREPERSGKKHFQLGGGFIGSGGGIIWNAFQIPLDTAGRTAAIRVNGFTYGADLAGLLATFDADTLTEFTGQGEMMSRDTFKFTFVGYGTKQGNPPLIRLIFVRPGTAKFTGPDSFVVNYTMDVYPAAADADGDGYPDPGTTPVLSIPGAGPAKRVPLP
jgi:hypothetical protein